MSKLASLALLVLVVPTAFILPSAPASAQACVAAPCPPIPPPPPPFIPPPPNNNPGSPGDPYVPPDDLVAGGATRNMLIACRIAGTPEAMPNDLKFRNIGDTIIPAATRVYWMIKESGDHGYFILPRDLPVGESIADEDVLKSGLPVTDHCYSKIM